MVGVNVIVYVDVAVTRIVTGVKEGEGVVVFVVVSVAVKVPGGKVGESVAVARIVTGLGEDGEELLFPQAVGNNAK